MTDLERLHDLFNRRENDPSYVQSRREGKTFLRCHELAGAVEVGDFETIIIYISYMTDLDYLIPMISEVFEEHKIKLIKHKSYDFEANNKMLLFITRSGLYRTRGLEAFYISMER